MLFNVCGENFVSLDSINDNLPTKFQGFFRVLNAEHCENMLCSLSLGIWSDYNARIFQG